MDFSALTGFMRMTTELGISKEKAEVVVKALQKLGERMETVDFKGLNDEQVLGIVAMFAGGGH